MIRITVELVSAISPARNRVLGTIEIANDNTGTEDVGNYEGVLKAEYTNGRRAKVMNFNRRTQSVMSLVGAFLKGWGHTKHSPKDIFPQ